MRRLLLTSALLLAGLAAAAPFRPPPPPTQWVTDQVGFLSPGVRSSLDQRLRRYQQDTGHQVVVWVGENQGDATLEEWAARTFEAWGLGQKGKDDGVGIFVFPRERRLRIEVGYGLEGDLPDAIANRILDEQVIPLLKAGQPDAAITSAVDQVLRTLGGERAGPSRVTQPRYTVRGHSPLTPGRLLFLGIVGILLLVLFITHPRLGMLVLWTLFSGGRGGGWGGGGWGGGGGGGFGGGGGRSGGGGASGSW